MPLPVLAGIPWLAGIIAGITVKLFDALADFLTRKVAVKIAFTGGVIALLVLLVSALQGVVSGLVYSVPSEIGNIIYWIIPSNLSFCVSAVITAKIARWVFEWHVKLLEATLPS